MSIKTGCFFYNYEKGIKISIAQNHPYCFDGPELKFLAPSWGLLNDYRFNRIDENEYTKLYKQYVLGKLIKDGVLKRIEHLCKNNNTDTAILCCWEKTGFCHRHIVAEWLGIEEAEHL